MYKPPLHGRVNKQINEKNNCPFCSEKKNLCEKKELRMQPYYLWMQNKVLKRDSVNKKPDDFFVSYIIVYMEKNDGTFYNVINLSHKLFQFYFQTSS